MQLDLSLVSEVCLILIFTALFVLILNPFVPNGISLHTDVRIHFEFKGCWVIMYTLIQNQNVHSQ